jgi:hypothetical protein
MNKKVLQLKEITAVEKLILLFWMDYPSILPIDTTSQFLSKELGVKRKLIQEALWTLEERGYVYYEIGYISRRVKFTQLFKELIK